MERCSHKLNGIQSWVEHSAQFCFIVRDPSITGTKGRAGLFTGSQINYEQNVANVVLED